MAPRPARPTPAPSWRPRRWPLLRLPSCPSPSIPSARRCGAHTGPRTRAGGPPTAQLTASGGHGASPRGRRAVRAGREIPPGAYEVWLTAQGSTNQVLKLEVGAGQRVHLDCNGFLKTCVTR
ncbi:MAG: hypothetical protein H6734_08855 [Alphaproteobacteria bacterium]|nr:hypothetical protein [Alphaproteobacteria bacterium]